MGDIWSRTRDQGGPRQTRPPHSHGTRPGITSVIMTATVLCALGLGGCEKTSHENIDRWMDTEKGPGKLEDALRSSDLEPDLRAHAAQNLVRLETGGEKRGEDVMIEALAAMPPEERDQVLDKLVPRLWENARIEGEMTVPSSIQVGAKDALFALRRLARGQTLEAIDRYLVEWLTGGYYEARARTGNVRGETIVRAVGPMAAPSLIRSAKSLLIAPTGKEGSQYQLEEPLLIGLAVSSSPEAVGFLLDLVRLEHNDKDLPGRAMDALFLGYVDSRERFELADPRALEPHLGRLVDLARDPALANRIVNDAIRLIGRAGAPACIKPLVDLIASPHREKNLLWVSANAALRCGKAQALVPVADALPQGREYAAEELEGAILEPMLVLDDKAAVAEQARTLLTSGSWIARAIGVELLGRLAIRESARADAEAVRKLTGDRTPLKGWWGDQKGISPKQQKAVPRLGERAQEVAKTLDQVSKNS